MNFGIIKTKSIGRLCSRYGGIIILWLIGLIVSFLAFIIVNYYEQQHSQQQFASSFKDKVTSLTQAVSAIDKVFLATHSMLDIQTAIKKEDFARLISNNFIANTGMQGIEWAPAILRSEQVDFENKVRQSGLFDYRIRAMPLANFLCTTKANNMLYPVLFAEPAETIGHESGLELSSDCKLSSKMFTALNSHKITSSSFYNDQGELGLRLLLPVYHQNNGINSALRGYIVGIVMMNSLIDSLWGDITRSLQEQLIIYSSGDNSQIIYDSNWRQECNKNCEPLNALMSLKTNIPFVNQIWSIEFNKYTVDARSDYYAYTAALVILVIIAGTSIYLWSNINRVSWANSLVAERTKSLVYQANHDDLTQLLNKQALSIELSKLNDLNGRRNDDGFSLLFIDLDHFKKVNDTKGHLVGDKLLQQVAQRLIQSARSEDLLFRFGGDEFVVLLNQGYCANIVSITATRILQRLEQAYVIDDNTFHISASIGIVMIEGNNINVSEVIRNADIAMYEAKRLGRGQIVFYQSDMYKSLVYRHDIENELAEVINKNGLSLYLQPIHNINGLVGFEALSRWQHPEKGMIFPDEFISIAEETGLIHQLGYWLLDATCQSLSMWIYQYGEDACPYISINVSPIQLQNSQIVNQIAAALQRYKIPAKLLAVELTESALIGNKQIVKDNLIKLRALKVRVFLDDFGTGYSSLSLLKDFPIDVLKIDRSFISGLDQASEDSQNLVKAIINMTHALNMKVVAEGVETNSVLNWLLSVQCDLMQGYYFSKPLSQQQLPLYLDSYQLRQLSAS
ncbi:MAG: EAL domain-containing protein [Colwellia sp.]|nr:EAL domain-containing protein [Colwellia sp.]